MSWNKSGDYNNMHGVTIKIPLLVHSGWIMQAMSVTYVRRLIFLSGDSSKHRGHALELCFWNSVLYVLHSVMMETVLILTNNVSLVASLSNSYKIQKRDANYSENHGNTCILYMAWPECRAPKCARRWKILNFQYHVNDRVS